MNSTTKSITFYGVMATLLMVALMVGVYAGYQVYDFWASRGLETVGKVAIAVVPFGIILSDIEYASKHKKN